MIRNIVVFILLFAVSSIKGQSLNTYVGIVTGFKFEVYEHTDDGSSLSTKPFFKRPMSGFTVGQELNKQFILESGLYFINYSKRYKVDLFTLGLDNVAIFALQIPVKLKARLNLIDNKLKLLTTVGYSLSINTNSNSTGYSMLQYGKTYATSIISDTADYTLRKTFPLLETSIGLEYQFKSGVLFSINAQYYLGLKRIIDMDVLYSINNKAYKAAKVFSNGSYFNFALEISYPISKFRQKNKKQ